VRVGISGWRYPPWRGFALAWASLEWERDMAESLAGRAELVAALRPAVFESPGHIDPGIRRAAGSGAPMPQPWGPYTEKVRDCSYRVTDADVAALKAAGRSEEEIFEVTVAAALGAALHCLDAGLRAVRGREQA